MSADQTAVNRPTLSPYAQWELAFVYAFVSVFGAVEKEHRDLVAFPDLQPEDLEQAIIQEQSDLLDELLHAFLMNGLNRKKPLEKKNVNRELSRVINHLIQTFELDLDKNPLQQVEFGSLEPESKLKILRALIEWQLQESSAVRSLIDVYSKRVEHNQLVKGNPLLSTPVGVDKQKRAYWHFGDAPWLWREKVSLQKGCKWETVCRSLEELEDFANTLSKSNQSERELEERIREDIIPKVESGIRKRLRKERARERQLLAEQLVATPRLRPRHTIRPPRYTYEEYDDDAFVEENGSDDAYSAETSHESTPASRSSTPSSQSTPAPRGTRSSKRLKGEKEDLLFLDDTGNMTSMNVD